MRFVLVEEDIKLIEKVKSIISKALFAYDIDYEVVVYKSCNSNLKKEIEDVNTIKTYILSVDMNQEISGIDIAEYIRKNDWNSNIIFLTNHGNMFETVHRKVCNVFEFIEKYQAMDRRLEKDIKKIIKYGFDNKVLTYDYHSSSYRIYYKSIKYISRDTLNRKLIIHTSNKDYFSNMTIKDMQNLLDKRFIRVSKSTIINMDYMEEINWNKGYIRLYDGSEIDSVSKKYKMLV